MRAPYEFRGTWSGRLATTAIHAGHDLRPALAAATALNDATRLREEDPFTDVIGGRAGFMGQVVVHRSRFEVDLNRPREQAVYRAPTDAWGLRRDGPLEPALVVGSLGVYDAFYSDLAARLDPIAAAGPFVLYDVHSYNHRRGHDHADAPTAENPDVNVGTGSLNREVFGGVVDAFMSVMTEASGLDVRENVRFKGANLARWTHERYPGVGCVLALEFKKTFMDEWTGEVDPEALAGHAQALSVTVDPVLDALARVPMTDPLQGSGDEPDRMVKVQAAADWQGRILVSRE